MESLKKLVPDGDGIWESFKDGVISLTRNENEDVSSSLSSSSSSEKPPAEKALKIRVFKFFRFTNDIICAQIFFIFIFYIVINRSQTLVVGPARSTNPF